MFTCGPDFDSIAIPQILLIPSVKQIQIGKVDGALCVPSVMSQPFVWRGSSDASWVIRTTPLSIIGSVPRWDWLVLTHTSGPMP